MAEIGNVCPKSRGTSHNQKAGDASEEVDRNVAVRDLIYGEGDRIEKEAGKKAASLKQPRFEAVWIASKPDAQNHPKCELGQPAQATTTEDVLTTGGVEVEKIDASKETERDSQDEEWNGPKFSQSRHENREKGKKLNDETEVPPSGVEVEKIVVDPEEAKPTEADPESPVEWLKAGLERADEVDEVSKPVHGVEPSEAVENPGAPGDPALLLCADSGLGENKSAGDQKKADGVEAKLRDADANRAGKC